MAYWAKAVRFDGSNDYLTRGANLTGVSDGKEGVFSCWVRFRGGDGFVQVIVDQNANDSHFSIFRDFDNSFGVLGRDSAGNSALALIGGSSFTVSSGWVHVLASWDAANGAEWLYINDADDAFFELTADRSIDYTQGEFAIGAETDGAEPINADIADFFLDLSTHLDLSVAANRRKFIDASGNPVDLGSNGSLPLGFAPDIFLHGDVSTWHSNDGTGGGFTENGALVESQGPTGYGINADRGEFDVSGQAVAVTSTRKLGAAAGSLTLTGQDVTLRFGVIMGADVGSFALTGQAAGLRRAHKLGAAVGAYTLDGQEVGLESANPAGGGAYVLSGQNVILYLSRRINRIRLTGLLVEKVYLAGRLQRVVKLQRETA